MRVSSGMPLRTQNSENWNNSQMDETDAKVVKDENKAKVPDGKINTIQEKGDSVRKSFKKNADKN